MKEAYLECSESSEVLSIARKLKLCSAFPTCCLQQVYSTMCEDSLKIVALAITNGLTDIRAQTHLVLDVGSTNKSCENGSP